MANSDHIHHDIEYIELTVTDMDEARRFYSGAFDWQFTDYGPEYVGIEKPGGGEAGGLRLETEGAVVPPLVIMYSSDLEWTPARAQDAGGTNTREIVSLPGSRRMRHEDTSGNQP